MMVEIQQVDNDGNEIGEYVRKNDAKKFSRK